jgi:hypothetical protein
VVRQTDSSLLDEWGQLTRSEEAASGPEVRPGGSREADAAAPRPLSANPRALRVLVRNALFRRVELAARGAFAELGDLDAADGWDAEAWQEAVESFLERHGRIDTGPDARGPHMLIVEEEGRTWRVQQILGDPAGDHDWRIRAVVDLDATDAAGELVWQMEGLAEV